MKLRLTYSTIFVGVLVVFFLSTGTGFGPYSTAFGPYWLATLLACVAVMLGLRPAESIRVSLRPAPMLGGLFFFALIVAAVLTPEGRVLQLVIPMIAQFICYLLAMWLASRFMLSVAFGWVALMTLSIVSFANLYEFFIAPQAFSDAPGRAAGFFVNPNNSGAAVAMLAFLALVGGQWRSQWLRTVIIAVAAIAVVVTFSRGSLILFAVLMVLVLFLGGNERKGVLRNALIPLVAMAGFVPWLLAQFTQATLSEGASMRLNSLLIGNFSDTSSQTRVDALQYYVRLFLGAPMSGSRPFGSLYEMSGMGPHNAFAALGADFGVLALAVPLLLIVFCVLRARQLGWRGADALILLGCAAWMFLASMFSHNVFYSSYGALVAGLAMGTLSRGRQFPGATELPLRKAP